MVRPPLYPVVYELWEQCMFARWAVLTLHAWARWRWAQCRLAWLYGVLLRLRPLDPRVHVFTLQAAHCRRSMQRYYRRHARLVLEDFHGAA